tara:strand:- start:662 stop:1054 length:393 start_codon:yes stop_codon:yes gene_type:complete
MRLDPFKNREINKSEKVEMYRCLNRSGKSFSLRQNGEVVAHTKDIALKDCEFKICKGEKKRATLSKTRNVHAVAKGLICDHSEIGNSFGFLLRYDPFSNLGFYIIIGAEKLELSAAKYVYLSNGNIFCQI